MGIFSDRETNVHGPSMGGILFIALFFLGGLSLFSQTTIWQEDFNDYWNDTRSGMATGASISGWNSGNSNSLSVQEGQRRGRNVGTTGRTWQTESINIHGYTSVSCSLNVRTNGSFEYGDYIIGEYRADGGSWEEFLDVSRSSLNNLNGTYTENIPPNTRTLEIRVR